MIDAASFCAGLPKWLQTAAVAYLREPRLPDPAEADAYVELCLAEAHDEHAKFSSLAADAFDVDGATEEVRVRRIHTCTAVNALDPRAVLDFGDASLVVIYGANGTGKSGYARLFKQATGQRGSVPLLPDVFSEQRVGEAIAATFELRRGAEDIVVPWAQTGQSLQALRHAHVFDAHVADRYLRTESEARYEPAEVGLFRGLAAICDLVSKDLSTRRGTATSQLPQLPGPLRSTSLAKRLLDLKPTDVDSFVAAFVPAPNHEKRRSTLAKTLGTVDPAKRIEQLAEESRAVLACRDLLGRVEHGLSAEAARALAALRSEVIARRAEAGAAAMLLRDAAALPGLGEETWRALWAAARAYSTQVAFPSCAFPYTGADSRCPLCHQALDVAAAARLQGFESFVQGTLERAVKEADAALSAALGRLPVVPSAEEWRLRFGRLPGVERLAETAHLDATERLRLLKATGPSGEHPALDFGPLRELVDRQLTALEEERRELGPLCDPPGRAMLEAEHRDLSMVDWCIANRGAIEAEIGRLRSLERIDKAKKLTATTKLTTRVRNLTEGEVTKGYQTRFAKELEALGGARLQVKPVQASASKAKVTHGLSLTKRSSGAAKPEDAEDEPLASARASAVLSEGEGRIAALAAFLADVTAVDARSPFLFDDPISSLDQEFEELVVKRLFELARTRQVIVFTHRLSLRALLEDTRKADAKVSDASEAQPAVAVKFIGLRRLGRRVGIVARAQEVKIKAALDELINGRLVVARQHSDAGEVDEYDSAMKEICSDLRIVTEKAIEDVLLNEVVLRFRRSVMTKDKLAPLAKIAPSDCALFEDLMGRLSVFEHSQSTEAPPPLPELATVEEDARKLRDWIAEFGKRKVSMAPSA